MATFLELSTFGATFQKMGNFGNVSEKSWATFKNILSNLGLGIIPRRPIFIFYIMRSITIFFNYKIVYILIKQVHRL